MPGAGKTMIAAIAIAHLQASAQNSSYGLAYVYYDYKEEEQDVSIIMMAVLKQVSSGSF